MNFKDTDFYGWDMNYRMLNCYSKAISKCVSIDKLPVLYFIYNRLMRHYQHRNDGHKLASRVRMQMVAVLDHEFRQRTPYVLRLEKDPGYYMVKKAKQILDNLGGV